MSFFSAAPSLLLLSPPAFKACEPPAALAFLAGALRRAGVVCETVDLNLEVQRHLLAEIPLQAATSTWEKRAVKNSSHNLAALQNPRTYSAIDRCHRTLKDLSKALELSLAARTPQAKLTLGDLHREGRSPLNSADLLQAAEHPEDDPFFAFFTVRLRQLLTEQRPQWIGISINFLSQAQTAFAILGWLAAEFPQLQRVAGGGLVTTWINSRRWHSPELQPLTALAHFIKGPGEEPLTRLLGGAAPGSSPDFTGIGRCSGDYLAPGFILPWAASRGCFWRRCRFCPETAEGTPFSHTPPEVCLARIEAACTRHNPILIHFLDNALTPLMLRTISRHRLPPWYGFVRFDGLLANPSFCRSLRRSGCVMLKLGLESGDADVLRAMRKGINLVLVERALANLKEAGIATYIYLLFGTPAEDRDAALRTRDFAARHSDKIDFLNLAIFNMPQQSPETAECVTRNFSSDDLSIYTDFLHPLGWDRTRIRRFLDTDFRRTPELGSILRRDPPFFTSNFAPLLLPGVVNHGVRQ